MTPPRFAVLLLAILTMAAQDAAAQTQVGERVWEDPARFRALAERAAPWPLRDYPAQPVTGFPERCGLDPRAEIRLGPWRTPLWVDPFGMMIGNGPTRSFQDWLRNRLRTGLDCPGDRTFDAFSFNLYLAEGVVLVLDRRCHAPGLPPDPRPECDRPGSGRFHNTFVRGLPHLIQISAPDARYATGDIIDGHHRMARTASDLEERQTRLGNKLLVSRGGTRVHGTVMRRVGDLADTLEPLFTDCSFEWAPPDPGEPRLARMWGECSVRFRFRGVIDVTYRFHREIFGEPDVPGLDLRVRGYLRVLMTPPTSRQ